VTHFPIVLSRRLTVLSTRFASQPDHSCFQASSLSCDAARVHIIAVEYHAIASHAAAFKARVFADDVGVSVTFEILPSSTGYDDYCDFLVCSLFCRTNTDG